MKKFLFVLAFLCLVLPVQASQSINACQTLNVSDTYILTGVIFEGAGNDCFPVNASNVVLDCAGNLIVSGGLANYGIRVDNVDNFQFHNCTFQNAQFQLADVFLNNSDTSKGWNNTFENPVVDSIFVNNSDSFNASYSTFISNAGTSSLTFYESEFGVVHNNYINAVRNSNNVFNFTTSNSTNASYNAFYDTDAVTRLILIDESYDFTLFENTFNKTNTGITIQVVDSWNGVIDNHEFHNSTGNSAEVSISGSTNVNLTDSFFHNQTTATYSFQGIGNSFVRVINNTFENTTATADVFVSGSSNSSLYNNSINQRAVGGSAFHFDDALDLNASENSIVQLSNSPVFYFNNTNNSIAFNNDVGLDLISTTDTGFYIYNSANVTLKHNEINGTTYGLNLSSAVNFTSFNDSIGRSPLIPGTTAVHIAGTATGMYFANLSAIYHDSGVLMTNGLSSYATFADSEVRATGLATKDFMTLQSPSFIDLIDAVNLRDNRIDGLCALWACNVTVKWRTRVNVTDKETGSLISGANISVFDVNSNAVNYSDSDSSGLSASLNLTEYYLIGDGFQTKVNLTSHNFTATHPGYYTNYTVGFIEAPTIVPLELDSPCGTITANTTLRKDFTWTNASHCINFGADDIMLNCSDFKITGNKTVSVYGIYADSFDNLRVENCFVEGFYEGIDFDTTNNSLVFNSTIYNSSYIGMYSYSANYLNVSYSNFTNVTQHHGVYTHSAQWTTTRFNDFSECYVHGWKLEFHSNNNTFSNNSLGLNGMGIYSVSKDNKIANNTAGAVTLYDNGDSPVSTDNIIEWNNLVAVFSDRAKNNTIRNNKFDGLGVNNCVYLHWDRNNTVVNNSITNCLVGIKMDNGADNHTFADNNVSYNTRGIWIQSGSYNVFKDNVFSFNTGDAIDIYAGSWNKFYNVSIYNNSDGVFLNGFANFNVLFQDSLIYDNYDNDLNFDVLGSHRFLNTTFNSSNVTISNGDFTREWYSSIHVIDKDSGADIADANVNATNVNGSTVFNLTSNATGWLAVQNVTEYFQNSTSIYNRTPHSFIGSKVPYQDNSTTAIISENTYFDLELSKCGSLTANATLTGDIDYTGGSCFTFEANDIELDCSGFSITGNLTALSAGINNTGFNNTVVKNCTFNGFEYGLFFEDSNASILTNNTFFNNSYGVWLTNSNYSNVSYSNVSYSVNDGVSSEYSKYSVIHDNLLFRTGNCGMSLYWAEYHAVDSNNVSNSIGCGFATSDSNFNLFIDNLAVYSETDDGFFVSGANNTFIRNNVSYGGYYGIEFWEVGTSVPLYNTFIDEVYELNEEGSIASNGGGYNRFVNCTFNKTNSTVTGGNFTLDWYSSVHVIDVNTGFDIANANVNATDVNGSVVFNLTSNATGWTSVYNTTEYFQNVTSVYNFTPHNFTGSFAGYDDNTTVSAITENRYFDLELDLSSSGLNLDSFLFANGGGGAVSTSVSAYRTVGSQEFEVDEVMNVTYFCTVTGYSPDEISIDWRIRRDAVTLDEHSTPLNNKFKPIMLMEHELNLAPGNYTFNLQHKRSGGVGTVTTQNASCHVFRSQNEDGSLLPSARVHYAGAGVTTDSQTWINITTEAFTVPEASDYFVLWDVELSSNSTNCTPEVRAFFGNNQSISRVGYLKSPTSSGDWGMITGFYDVPAIATHLGLQWKSSPDCLISTDHAHAVAIAMTNGSQSIPVNFTERVGAVAGGGAETMIGNVTLALGSQTYNLWIGGSNTINASVSGANITHVFKSGCGDYSPNWIRTVNVTNYNISMIGSWYEQASSGDAYLEYYTSADAGTQTVTGITGVLLAGAYKGFLHAGHWEQPYTPNAVTGSLDFVFSGAYDSFDDDFSANCSFFNNASGEELYLGWIWNVTDFVNNTFAGVDTSTVSNGWYTPYCTFNDTAGLTVTQNLTNEEVQFTNCGALTANATLGGDIDFTGGSCLTIGANGIELDCAGYYVAGNKTISSYGVTSTFDNVVIKNCEFKGFYDGVHLTSANNSILFNNTIWNNTRAGMYLETGSNYSNTSYNNISYNAGDGFDAHDSHQFLKFERNWVEGLPPFSGVGIYLDGSADQYSDYAKISNNTFLNLYDGAGNGQGISTINAQRMNISYNNVSYTDWGLEIGTKFNTVMFNNISYTQFYEGIGVENGNNTFIGNNVSYGVAEGILFSTFVMPAGQLREYNVFINDNYQNHGVGDVVSTVGGYNRFLNTTFNKTNSTVTGGNFTVEWDTRVNVTNSTGYALSGANVTAYDVNGTLLYSLFTYADGYTDSQNVTEYFQNSTSIYNYSTHNFTASLAGYTDNTTSWAISQDENNTVNIVLFASSSPGSPGSSLTVTDTIGVGLINQTSSWLLGFNGARCLIVEPDGRWCLDAWRSQGLIPLPFANVHWMSLLFIVAGVLIIFFGKNAKFTGSFGFMFIAFGVLLAVFYLSAFIYAVSQFLL